MTTSKILFLAVVITSTLILSCSSDEPKKAAKFVCEVDNPVSKNGRVIGLDLLNLTQSNTFQDNLDLGSELGIEFIALHLPWSSIETSPGNFTDPGDALFLLNQVAVDNNLKFSLTIRPIDIVGKTVPDDLMNTRFNETVMIDRFKALMDFVFTKIDVTVLHNLQVGNEIDGYDNSSEHPDFWLDYGVFLNGISEHVHNVNANILLGFTGTHNGLLKQSATFNQLAENVDILGVTYYPLKPNFDVQDPSVIFNDFDDLVASYGSSPIYLQEVGYQSSDQNNSSEALQAAFYCNFWLSSKYNMFYVL